MEAGALFILVILLVLIGIAGFIVALIAARLRGRKLSSRADEIEGDVQPRNGQRPDGRAGERPEHTRVETEQETRSIPHR